MLRTLRALPLLSIPFAIAATIHCGGTHVDPEDTDAGVDATPPPPPADAGTSEIDPPLIPASKVDLLLVVDNSATMGDKQTVIAGSVSTLLRRLVQPRCIDPNDATKVLGTSTNGACAAGVLEHAPITDLHVGVISTSLQGAVVNPNESVCNPASNPRHDDKAHLLNGLKGGGTLATAPQGFIHFAKAGGTISDPAELEKDVAQLIIGVDQTGCGFEAQLESMYRFLVEPDPPQSITLDKNNRAQYTGFDDVLLAQRKAFLRPDSAVAIVMLTDEDDSSADDRSIGGQGWTFGAKSFPGSKVFRGASNQGTTAPRGTSACSSNPASPDCTSCAFAPLCNESDPACQKLRNDPNCLALGSPPRGGDGPQGYAGYYGPEDDSLSVRFHRMKERYGIDPQFPIARYVRGLTNRRVPNRTSDHDADGNYVDADTCQNPLFAASLPASSQEKLCERDDGSRSRQLVFFALIGGLSKSLAKPVVAATDWTKVLGANPDAYDLTGIDPHMIPSVAPRAGLPPPSNVRGDNGTDPEHGREWDTQKNDLQYACTFDLPQPRTCSAADPSCDCRDYANPPLCKDDFVNGVGTQVRAKAHPSIRELRLAKALGDRAIASSICAFEPSTGYGAALDVLASRMAPALSK